jgi:hypothetical protein
MIGPRTDGPLIECTVALVADVGTGGRNERVGWLVIGGGNLNRIITGLPLVCALNLIRIENRPGPHQIEPIFSLVTSRQINMAFGNGAVEHNPTSPPAGLDVIGSPHHLTPQIGPLSKRGVPLAAQVMIQAVQFEKQRIDAVVRILGNDVGRSA